jgi:hypothetical protein
MVDHVVTAVVSFVVALAWAFAVAAWDAPQWAAVCTFAVIFNVALYGNRSRVDSRAAPNKEK